MFSTNKISNYIQLTIPKSGLLKILIVSYPDFSLANTPSAFSGSLLSNDELLDLEMMQQFLMGEAYE